MIDESSINKAITDMADKLRIAESVNTKHREDIQTMVDKINGLEKTVAALSMAISVWAAARRSTTTMMWIVGVAGRPVAECLSPKSRLRP